MLVALSYDRVLAWLALLAAADMVLLLAIGRWPAGPSRALLAVAATGATIVAANFGIAAGQVGQALGLLPWQSALKMGSHYAWTLASLAGTPLDLAAYGTALVVAGWAGLSARRPVPSAR